MWRVCRGVCCAWCLSWCLLWCLLWSGSATRVPPATIVHVINLVPNPGIHEQEFATGSVVRAAEYARERGILVDLAYAEIPGTHPPPPPAYDRVIHHETNRSGFHAGTKTLPFLVDILDGAAGSTARAIVWTNADIGLRDDFYVEILKRLDDDGDGRCDAISATRVTLNRHVVRGVEDYSKVYERMRGEAIWKQHNGHDCIIFPARKLESVMRHVGSVFVGFPPVGNTFMKALRCAGLSTCVQHPHLTFHVGPGNEMTNWRSPGAAQQTRKKNKRRAQQALANC